MSLRAQGIVQPHRIEVDELCIRPGQCVVLCGPNGSGKSSLLRVLAGVDRPKSGTVSIEGQALSSLSPLQKAAHLAWLPQRSTISDAWTVEALVACARYRFFESQSIAEQRSIELLERYDLGHLTGRLASAISGGELQRVLIVSLVAQQTSILMLDEPANHLDPRHQVTTYESLGRLWREGKSVVIVSHDVRLARLLGDDEGVRVIGIKDGQVRFESTLSDPHLYAALGELYQAPFLPPSQPGSLALDLNAARTPKEGS